jgi:hypothetical protein
MEDDGNAWDKASLDRTLILCGLKDVEERILLGEDSGFNTHPSGYGFWDQLSS